MHFKNINITKKVLRSLHPEIGEDQEMTSTVTSEVTTKFVDDGEIKIRSLTTTVDKGHVPDQFESIKDFLGKPYLIYNGAWPAVGTTNGEVDDSPTGASYHIGDWLTPGSAVTYNQHWIDKMIGFRYFRATAVFRVVLNAQPFQAGKLLIHFLPCTSNMQASYTLMHNANYTTKTQQPSIVLDAADTLAELEIPFISPYDYMTVPGVSTNSWGTVYLSVLTPLRTGPNTTIKTAPLSIYLYFKDVELTGPLVPELAGGGSNFKAKTASLQEAETIYKDESISRGLSQISSGLSSLGSVPMLSSVTGPAAWATRVMSKAASAFGYSKPTTDSPPSVSSRALSKYSATSTGIDTSFPLSVYHDSGIAISDGYTPFKQDEMCIDHLKTIPAVTSLFSWTTSDLAGAELAAIYIKPDVFFQADTGPTKTGKHVNYAVGPPMWYFTKMFAVWRGSIKIKLQFAKTIFHTGRLQITFTPGDGVITTPTLVNSDFALREIVDLKTSNEVSFTLPYLLPYDFQKVGGHMGKLSIRVLNPLRCPDTCAVTTDFVLWASAGDDFQYAIPNAGNTTAQTATGFPVVYSPELSEDDGPIGNTVIPKDTTYHAMRCIGEEVHSIRDLLLRYNLVSHTTGLWPVNLSDSAVIWPWFNSIVSLSAAGAVVSPNYGGDAYPFFANMYLLYRGGMRIQAFAGVNNVAIGYPSISAVIDPNYVDASTALPVSVLASSTYLPISNRAWATLGGKPGLGMVYTDHSTGPPTFRVPYYCKMKASFNLVQAIPTGTIPTHDHQPTSLLIMNSYGQMAGFGFNRSIDEDFQFTYFLGCPPLFVALITE